MREVEYDGVDNDCNATTLDDDLDEDDFLLAEDCDDLNEAVNPEATETPYDGVDNDCDDTTLDDDLDQDGFVVVDDCDDLDPTVNPGVIEVLDDGVDNDCDPTTTDDGCVPTSGLTSLWRFDDDLTDAIGSNDGTSNAPAFEDGFVGRSLVVEAQSGFAIVPHSPDLTGLGDLTVHAWIRTTAIPIVRGQIFSIYRCGNLQCNGWDTIGAGVNAGGTLDFGVRDRDEQTGGETVTGQVVVNDGTFHHVAFVRDRTNSEARIYVDGQLDNEISLTRATRVLDFTSDDPLMIGAQYNCGVGSPGPQCPGDTFLNHFEGAIDEVTFARRVLDDTAIQAIYDAGAVGYCGP